MCGIAGVLSIGGGIEAWREPVQRAVARMARRGPDDEGVLDDGAACAFGFRRLAILDLTPAGHQPMATPDGRYMLVLNGEVYNFRELRAALAREGAAFRSTGDAEVVLHALARWGTAALERFRGMFAIGFYDARDRTLLLARDHAGMKPLYLARSRDALAFASQYDALACLSAHRDVDPAALSLYLHFGYLPAPWALLRGTAMLEPGTWLRVSTDGTERSGRHFEFPVRRRPDLRGSAAIEAVDAAVGTAVARHLVSDVRVGVFLSGGVDSPLIAARAAELAGERVPAFTIGTAGGEFDESEDASAYARELGLEHHVRHIRPDRTVSMLEDVFEACAEPLDDYSIFPALLASRLAADHVKVVLSGDGGDELFFGYAARSRALLRAAGASRAYAARWAPALRRLGRRLAGAAPMVGAGVGAEYARLHRFLPESFLRAIFPELPPWPEEFRLYDTRARTADEIAQWVRWNEYTGHLTRVLLKVDRASMFHSLEVRVPLLDRDLIDVATRVDWRSSLDRSTGLGKLPLRAALGRHVHAVTTAKRPFTVSMSDWLSGPLRPVFEDVVSVRDEILGLPVDRAALRSAFDAHVERRADHRWGLWRLLALCLWERRHLAPVAA
jgi:asparagine synthase (glutamine-hydrolysing)